MPPALSLMPVVCRSSPASVWTLSSMGRVLTGYAVVCLWDETGHQLHQNWGHAELCGHMWCGQQIMQVPWGRGPTLLGLSQAWLRRAVPPEHRGLGLVVSKSGSQCPHWALSLRVICVHTEERGKEMEPVSSFVPHDAPHWRAPRISNNLTHLCPKCSSYRCFHAVYPQVVSLPSVQDRAVPSWIFPS